jgi:hypothetical protein
MCTPQPAAGRKWSGAGHVTVSRQNNSALRKERHMRTLRIEFIICLPNFVRALLSPNKMSSAANSPAKRKSTDDLMEELRLKRKGNHERAERGAVDGWKVIDTTAERFDYDHLHSEHPVLNVDARTTLADIFLRLMPVQFVNSILGRRRQEDPTVFHYTNGTSMCLTTAKVYQYLAMCVRIQVHTTNWLFQTKSTHLQTGFAQHSSGMQEESPSAQRRIC